ncbi:MAG: peptidoglycan-binding domain-containing protein [Candidatus Paceibacterota bacterium]|jgi:hypothetical protein
MIKTLKLAQPKRERERERVNSPNFFNKNVRFIAFFLILSGSFLFIGIGQASATTYYVRADGTVTAANKANATSPNAVGTSLNMAQVKLATFGDGDQILFSSQGGNYTEILILPSGGSGVDTEITYANVPNETPAIVVASGYLISTNGKSNIIVQGFSCQYTGTTVSTIGILIGAGSNIKFNNITSDMGGYGYNIWSDSILNNIVIDNVVLTNSGPTKKAMSFTGTGNDNITLQNSVINTGDLLISNAANLTITNSTSTLISINTGLNLTITNSTLTGIALNNVATGTISNITGSSGAGFSFTDSSNIVVDDSSMSNSTAYGAFELMGATHDITYNSVSANHNSMNGFVARGTSYNITYNNCMANNNNNIGFLSSASASDIIYLNSEASYNGTVNETSDGGGFLPHDSTTNIKCYYCIAHHNYNEGFGDVSDGTNYFYNSIGWSNGYAVGDLFKESTVITASIRGNNYYNKPSGNLTVQNGILGGNGKPREILNRHSSYTTFDYNLYKPFDDSKFYNTDDNSNNTSWATYHSANELNSNNSDPLFVNATGNYTAVTDFQLSYLSPAIDAGTDVSLTTDYAGNSIYGTPDIGAYEYQPPYTVGTTPVPTSGSIRIYSDNKYRALVATTTATTIPAANFSVTPVDGFYTASTSQYMDITIDSWLTSGTKNKQWTATSSIAAFNTHATSTVYTIGDLTPSTYYTFNLDSSASTTAITNNSQCTNGICKSDADGSLTFTYVGGYSTHTFALTKDTTAPASFSLTAPANNDGISKGGTLSWTASSDTESGLAPYELYIDDTLIGSTSDTSVSVPTSISCSNTHSWYIKALDNNDNSTNSNTQTFTIGCGFSHTYPRVTPVVATTTPTSLSSEGELRGASPLSSVQVSSILAVLASFGVDANTIAKVQAALLGETITTSTVSTSSFTPSTGSTSSQTGFARDLKLNTTGTDVQKLQQFLNTHGFILAESGPGSPGNETTKFGALTKAALIRFQKANNITPAVGYFGPLTRAAINSAR